MSGGKTVLSSGLFTLAAAISIASDALTIEGQGREATTLKLAASVNDYAITFDTAATHTSCRLADFHVDGNSTNQASGGCIKAFATRLCDFERLKLEKGKDSNLWLTGNGGGAGIGYYNKILGCEIANGSGKGVYEESNEANLYDGNTIAWNADEGMYIWSSYSRIVNGQFDHAYGPGIYVRGSTLVKIINNNFIDPQQECIFLDESGSQYCIAAFNTSRPTDSGRTANTYDDIYIKGGSYNKIFANTIEGDGRAKYGIAEDTGSDYNQILNNTLAGTYGTAATNKVGANSVWSGPGQAAVFATGAGHTVDQLITFLQGLGLAVQS